MYCVHNRCKNNSRMGTENVAFFRFPKDQNLRKKWKEFCDLSEKSCLTGSSRLCSLHFNPADIYRSPKGKILRTSTALPINADVPQLANKRKKPRPAETKTRSCQSQNTKASVVETPDLKSHRDLLEEKEPLGEYIEQFYTEVEFLEDGIDDEKTLCMLKEMQSLHGIEETKQGTQCMSDSASDKHMHCDCNKLKNQLSKSQAEKKKLKRKLEEVESGSDLAALKKVLTSDQIRLMTSDIKKMRSWSNDTIVEGLQTTFACGSAGYEFIREKYCLPSTRSLQERLNRIHFDTGTLNDVYYFMRIKMQHIRDDDKDCLIVLDEMAIEPGRQWCQVNQKFYGKVSLPDHSGNATHLLIVMVVGIRSRWKQIVGFHFTGETINNGCLKNILLDVIQRSEDIGLRVHAVVTDCGANNKKLWNDFGIFHTQHCVLSNAPILHPTDLNRNLEIMPDSIHVFKSMIHGWINNLTITIPDEIVVENGLTNVADIRHITDLVKYERGASLKMSCGLQLEDVDFGKKMNNFDKMKVSNSTKYANTTVVAALRFYAEQEGRKEVFTTAFVMVNWFTTMKSRSKHTALVKENQEAYYLAINQLQIFRNMVFDWKVGAKGYWKPWQSSVILATDSFLRLQHYLLKIRNYEFVLGGRFTQDCVENVFGQLRQKHKRPTALQAKNDLKLLTVSQYMNDVKNQSYDWDNPPWLLNFEDDTKLLASNRSKDTDETHWSSYQENSMDLLNTSLSKTEGNTEDSLFSVDTDRGCSKSSEENVVFYIAGVILKSVFSKCTTCAVCYNSCVLDHPENHEFSRYCELKDFTGNSLVYVNLDTYNFFQKMEGVYKLNIDQLLLKNDKIYENLQILMQSIEAPHIPDCHTLKNKIMKRFIIFRLHAAEIKNSRQKRFDSRSMYV